MNVALHLILETAAWGVFSFLVIIGRAHDFWKEKRNFYDVKEFVYGDGLVTGITSIVVSILGTVIIVGHVLIYKHF